MSTHAVEARGLTVHVAGAQGRPLLDRADFAVRSGRSAAIVGRSGAGKSTVLSVLGLMRRPDGGDLRIAGADPARETHAGLARLRNGAIGFVFQDYSLLAHLTVLENVALPFLYGASEGRKAQRQAAEEMLALVGLSGFERRRPRQLSGGEQQRVAIARALVRSPALVLADEPTGALDAETGARILDVLARASRARNTSLVVVTHDPLVAQAADDVWRLHDGRLTDAAVAHGGAS